MSIKFIVFLNFLFVFFSLNGQNYLSRDWTYYEKKGNAQYKAGMYDFAFESFEKVIDRNPQAYKAANMLAILSIKSNKKQQALEWYRHSLKAHNTQADIHFETGQLYEFFADYDIAVHHYSEAIRIKDNHILANMALVRFFIKKNDTASAKRHYSVSKKAALTAYGASLKKAQQIELLDMKKAELLYREIIAGGPSLLEAHEGLFNLYRRMKEYSKAAETIEYLKRLKPDHERAWVYAGNLYFDTVLPGNTRAYYLTQAIKNLKKAHELNPNNAETLYTLSRVYAYIKDTLNAEKYLKMAQAADKE